MYPVSYDVGYQIERNRLTTFFRLIVAIPWLVWASLYGIAAFVVVVIAWFALMFTKRYPQWAYGFVSGYVRLAARVTGFVALATDEFPPFGGGPRDDYPVQVDVAPRQPEYRRSRTFFKYVLYFPQYLILAGLGGVLQGAAFVTWWRILFTGKQSITMHDALRLSLAYNARSGAFILLLTEAHPRLLELAPQEPPPGAPGILA